jgi:hypothetical protein
VVVHNKQRQNEKRKETVNVYVYIYIIERPRRGQVKGDSIHTGAERERERVNGLSFHFSSVTEVSMTAASKKKKRICLVIHVRVYGAFLCTPNPHGRGKGGYTEIPNNDIKRERAALPLSLSPSSKPVSVPQDSLAALSAHAPATPLCGASHSRADTARKQNNKKDAAPQK